MTNRQAFLAATLLGLALLGNGCVRSVPPSAPTTSTPATVASPAVTAVPASQPTANVAPGSWVPSTRGPWDGTLYRATSRDGLSFGSGTLVLKRAGVPNLLRTKDGRIILTYQYFSDTDQSMFDVISYSASDDDGATWTDPKAIMLSELPAPLDEKKHPMDPTLVQADDGSLRLYFTYHASGRQHAELYSATNARGDIAGTFVANPTPALSIADKNLLDPSVVLFDGTWHHFSWQDGSDDNFHSTSADGLTFARQADVNLPMDFLGQAVSAGSGIRMYGTGKGGIISAFSADGFSWKTDSGSRAQGADPGVTRLADGTYLMVYAAANFNEAPR